MAMSQEEAVYAVISGPEDLDKWRGKLKGKIVLAAAPHASEMVAEPYLHRLTDAELAQAAGSRTQRPEQSQRFCRLGSRAAQWFRLRAARAGEAGAGGPGGGRGAGGRGGAAGRGGAGGGRGFAAELNKFPAR